MEIGVMIAGLVVFMIISAALEYFTGTWASKLGAKEALKEEGIIDQLQAQTMNMNQIKGDISNINNVAQSAKKDTQEIKNQLEALQNVAQKR